MHRCAQMVHRVTDGENRYPECPGPFLDISYTWDAEGPCGDPAVISIWPAVIAVGLLATAGQLLMTYAYARDTASNIAAVRFIGPVWGIAGDVLFFGGWPAVHVWAGGAIVVAAGLAATLTPKAQRQ